MYKFLLFLVLIGTSQYLVAAEEKSAARKEKPEFTQEQLDKLKAAEEQFKDSPEMMNFINKIKEQSGLNEPPVAAPAEAAPQEPAIQGSRSVADEAYESGDYETAFKHYEALAAEGDADASLILGTMYEKGQGTGKDPAAAHAWYKQAADAGDERGEELMKLVDDKELSDEDKMKAQEKYEAINQQQAEASENEGMDYADQGYRVLINPDALQRDRVKYVYTQAERTVKISPEKYQPEHQELQTGSEHYQPQKYQRPVPAAIEIINR